MSGLTMKGTKGRSGLAADKRRLAILAGVTALFSVAAIVAVSVQESSVATRFTPEPFFSELNEESALAHKIVFTIGKGMQGTQSVTLTKQGDIWVVEERGNYPAVDEKVQQVLTGLVDLEKFEPRTANPEFHRQLGLREPENLGRAVRLQVLGEDDVEILSLLTGETVEGVSDTQGRGLLYARRDGADQTWLTRGRLPLNGEVTHWLDTDVLNIERADIRELVLWSGSPNPTHLSRPDADERNFSIVNLPEGRVGRGAAIINGSAVALATAEIEDVAPVDAVTFVNAPHVEMTTFDGVHFGIDLMGGRGSLWARFEVTADQAALDAGADPVAVQERVDALKAKLDGWAFKLDERSSVKLIQTMDGLTRPAEG
ncbi:MAG: DUF4340 domain-containing protein [Parvibaculaceae bacterium]|nr:DUF4340 domain-containing protein [Parvibaculaceae bacterium]